MISIRAKGLKDEYKFESKAIEEGVGTRHSPESLSIEQELPCLEPGGVLGVKEASRGNGRFQALKEGFVSGGNVLVYLMQYLGIWKRMGVLRSRRGSTDIE